VGAVKEIVDGELLVAAAVMGGTALAMAVVMGMAYAVYRYYRPLGLRIGTDGVRVDKWLAGHRFIPYRDITGVDVEVGSVTLRVGDDMVRGQSMRREGGKTLLVLGDGTERTFDSALIAAKEEGAVVLALTDGTAVQLIGADQVVAQRIREAMATQERRRATGLRIERLDRGEHDEGAWKARLAEVSKPSGDYRGGGLGETGLLEVVEDPGATPEQRVAAAYALSRIEEVPRHRIAVAAQACADEDLRVALEEAAAGELEVSRIERSMSRFETA
jgi:hypothetical protein